MKTVLRFGRSLVVLFLLGMTAGGVFAAEANNIYGIHLAQPHAEDIKAAADLVNSNGGDWGYITLVIQENDRDLGKWQGIFDELRRLHLIPIIRLATSPVGENWRRPEPPDAQNWVDFLNSLNWVTKNRYVILFNEPNHGSEWGGEVDEKSYAEVAIEFAKKLKEKNKNFFVMLAGFDASAPSFYPGLEDEAVFLRDILRQAEDDSVNLFDYIDGWSSHSYPNPGFSGTPWDYGRGTIRTYQWELDLLKELGVNKELPVFITETGWRRGNEATVADYFYTAYNDLWSQDTRILAVTPFVLDYQGPPFLEFSWKKYNSQNFYQQYFAVQSIPKTKGASAQIQEGKISFKLPHELVTQSKYDFRINLTNNGQAIWDKNDDYSIQITEDGVKASEFLISDLKDIEPFQEKTVDFSLKTTEEGKQNVKFILTKNGESILESKSWNFNILPLPSLNFEVNFFPFFKGKGDNFEVQIFDSEERLVFKKKGVKVEDGKGMVADIQNIALDERYRVVILRPGYLPRQSHFVFKREDNLVEFKSMWGIDFNEDGKFELQDLFYFFTKFFHSFQTSLDVIAPGGKA